MKTEIIVRLSLVAALFLSASCGKENIKDDAVVAILKNGNTDYYKQIISSIEEESRAKGLQFMPKMQTDIMLKRGNRTLIIDTKYYGNIMQTHFDKKTIHQNNMYQISAYVNNEDKFNTGNVSGMLLYAKTQEDSVPDTDVIIKGNRYLVKTLDLNTPFDEIRKQLDCFVQYL